MRRVPSVLIRFPMLVLLLVGLTGCVNLKAVRSFTDRSADIAGYTELTTFYIEHFDHVREFRTPAQQANLTPLAEARRKQEDALLGLQRGVGDYLNVLGTLASDELVSYDKSLGGLADELKDAKVISDSKADAFGSLAKLIARAATDGYRRKKIKEFIVEANDPFQKVIGALKEIVGRDFVREIDNELGEVKSYYGDAIRAAQADNPAVVLVKEKMHTRTLELEERKRACQAYVEALTKISQGHQALFDRRDELPARETLDLIYGYGQEVAALRKKIKELK